MNGNVIITIVIMLVAFSALFQNDIVEGFYHNFPKKEIKVDTTTQDPDFYRNKKEVDYDSVNKGYYDLYTTDLASAVLNPKEEKPTKPKTNTYEEAVVPLQKDMCSGNIFDENSAPIVFERLVHAQRRNRLRQHGCSFRGDLNLIPDAYKPGYNPQTFRNVAKPEESLVTGYIQTINL